MKELSQDLLKQITQEVARRLREKEGLAGLVAHVQAENDGIRIVLRDGSSAFVPIVRTAGGKFGRGDAIIQEQSH